MDSNLLMRDELAIILLGVAAGTAARIVTLRVDARQNPSYPNGVFINIITGFIAAALGAVAIPALLERNFTAVTFFTLAIQHFRDFRKMEQDSLTKLEETDYHPRGAAYIDGIAKTYESRHYIALVTAFSTVLVLLLLDSGNIWLNVFIAAIWSAICIILLYYFTKGPQIGDLCTVHQGEISLQGAQLYVDGVFVTNTLGSESSQSFFRDEGMAFVVTPNTTSARLSIENYGQRQAMLYEAIRAFGVKRFRFSRRSFSDGRVIIAFIPSIPDAEGIIDAIAHTPILESSRKAGLQEE